MWISSPSSRTRPSGMPCAMTGDTLIQVAPGKLYITCGADRAPRASRKARPISSSSRVVIPARVAFIILRKVSAQTRPMAFKYSISFWESAVMNRWVTTYIHVITEMPFRYLSPREHREHHLTLQRHLLTDKGTNHPRYRSIRRQLQPHIHLRERAWKYDVLSFDSPSKIIRPTSRIRTISSY